MKIDDVPKNCLMGTKEDPPKKISLVIGQLSSLVEEGVLVKKPSGNSSNLATKSLLDAGKVLDRVCLFF